MGKFELFGGYGRSAIPFESFPAEFLSFLRVLADANARLAECQDVTI